MQSEREFGDQMFGLRFIGWILLKLTSIFIKFIFGNEINFFFVLILLMIFPNKVFFLSKIIRP